jgi:glyoxylase I family protein
LKIEFHHVCIETDCYRRSIEFYEGILGFHMIEETLDFHEREYTTWLKKDNVIIELQTPKRGSSETTRIGNIGLMHVCFEVSAIDECIEEIESKGYTGFLDGKRKYKVKDGFLSKVKAPEGTIIELREKKQPELSGQ